LISPLGRQWKVLWELLDRLRELGYDEVGVSQSMGVNDHSVRDWRAWPAHVLSCRRQMDTHPRAALASFFLMEEMLEEGLLRDLLGSDAVDVMKQLRWVEKVQTKLYFRYFLYPLLGSFILTDGHVSNPNSFDQVYHLGPDSHSLARLAPRPIVEASLDLCTGSGVHAVLASSHCQRSYGLDISPRALDFSRLNAKLNGRTNALFLESDCYQKVTPANLSCGDCRFDLITANPPFVPTPEILTLCRGGGVSGEEVTEKIVRGLPEKLSSQGIFSMITNVPIFKDQTFFDRCKAWLGSDETWGMVILSNHVWTPASYILGHQSPASPEDYGRQFQDWLEAYESVQLEAITNSQVYLFRSSFAWRIHRHYSYPGDSVSGFIECWLDALRSFEAGSVTGGYRIHPGLDKIWWMGDGSRVYLEWKPEYRWWQPQGFWLEGAAAQAFKSFGSEQSPPEQDPAALWPLLTEHLITRVGG
jgi:SAM-dependent methyltransferase